jgi:hypothetical protein
MRVRVFACVRAFVCACACCVWCVYLGVCMKVCAFVDVCAAVYGLLWVGPLIVQYGPTHPQWWLVGCRDAEGGERRGDTVAFVRDVEVSAGRATRVAIVLPSCPGALSLSLSLSLFLSLHKCRPLCLSVSVLSLSDSLDFPIPVPISNAPPPPSQCLSPATPQQRTHPPAARRVVARRRASRVTSP